MLFRSRLLRGAQPADNQPADGQPGWQPPVVTCSALEGDGVDNVWRHLVRHQDSLAATGALARRREEQQIRWVRALVREALLERYAADPRVRALAPEVERAVAEGRLTPAIAAGQLLDAYTNLSASSATDC